jgi:hypothetical protein
MTKENDVVKIVIKPDLVTQPFSFNPLKHHLGYIKEFVRKAQLFPNESETFELINSIGPQLTDIYCGLYSVDLILAKIRMQLEGLSAFSQPGYDEWIDKSGKDYNFLDLPDGSRWTFRKGEKKECYIHFHPARAIGSVRIRGTTLKTAIGLIVISKENSAFYKDINFINFLRQKRLQLSPIKSIANFPAIVRALDLLGWDEEVISNQ